MKLTVICTLLIAGLYLSGCAAHTNLMPVGKGNAEVSAGLGGPFITVSDMKIPAPYITLGGLYGLKDDINLNANIHVTSFMYKVAGIDLGAAWFPLLNYGWKPAVGIQPGILMLASLKENVESRFRLYPMLSGSLAWKVPGGTGYTGLDMLFLPAKPEYDSEAPSYIASPFAGYRFPLSEKIKFCCELKWQAANVEGYQLAPEYLSIGKHGAFTVLLSVSRSL
ncbi:MAG: hypothetical protein ACM3Q2_10580 [Syntrophothermus sp.]